MMEGPWKAVGGGGVEESGRNVARNSFVARREVHVVAHESKRGSLRRGGVMWKQRKRK